MKYILSFFQDHFLVQSKGCLDNVLMFEDNVKKCLEMSRCVYTMTRHVITCLDMPEQCLDIHLECQ